ncbi:TIGR03767 family metallophosphoesterase [Gryllotalpicola ginsengisoli]|uniref:TIGR03767 family metallophosphoesterase n=1 Tax=Gryllotalpicola ginsengisoli TaxID=444608 RepID=UPI0003B6E8C8|nr:TIGR03767 family metallophosphoesterase [Gryllotalpicola ginsengisoli]
MGHISRRSLLVGGTGAAAVAVLTPSLVASRRDAALAETAERAITTTGTTLEAVAAPSGTSGYRRLVAGPGYALVVREDLAAAQAGRDDRREGIASIVHFTDLHITDAQSPARFEFLVEYNGSAFRPHEALGSQGASRLVARVNELAAGPFTGRAFDCVVSTGDNSDNNESIELEWFLTVLNGGEVQANTGSTTLWEGVQSSGDTLYWNPELPVADRYKNAGFPELPGYFGRAIAPHTSPGLNTPWYSVFGNHDDDVSGTLANVRGSWNSLYTGDVKFTGFASSTANAALKAAISSPAASLDLSLLLALPTIKTDWIVTPDARRVPFTKTEYVRKHLEAAHTGPGPVGHGFQADDVDAGRSYYSWQLAPGVVGISMDSTNAAGLSDGSLRDSQWLWLKEQLTAHADQYVVLFSHHTSGTMEMTQPDPEHPLELRHSGSELVDLLHEHPNVVAWVNGHTHVNAITPQPGDTPQQSFWEINTASHTDFPQQARIVELVKNGDGTLSLFTTLIESDAPYQAPYDDGSQTSLASLYRELSFNDLGYDATRAGTAADRNAELLLVDPFA